MVSDAATYVHDVLRQDAPEIPSDLYLGRDWIQGELELSALAPDQEMIARHDRQQRHVDRRDRFIAAIRSGTEIPPLIVLGPDRKLVDGYARIRALRLLGVERAQVLQEAARSTA
jgi:hypothetical protein